MWLFWALLLKTVSVDRLLSPYFLLRLSQPRTHIYHSLPGCWVPVRIIIYICDILFFYLLPPVVASPLGTSCSADIHVNSYMQCFLLCFGSLSRRKVDRSVSIQQPFLSKFFQEASSQLSLIGHLMFLRATEFPIHQVDWGNTAFTIRSINQLIKTVFFLS